MFFFAWKSALELCFFWGLKSALELCFFFGLGVWHCAVVLGDIILFIVAPTAPSSSDSSSDQSTYESSHNKPDLDNVDPDFPEDGYWRS